MSFFSCPSFIFACRLVLYLYAKFRILKFQDSVYQKAEVCSQTINEWRTWKRSVVLLSRQQWDLFITKFNYVYMYKLRVVVDLWFLLGILSRCIFIPKTKQKIKGVIQRPNKCPSNVINDTVIKKKINTFMLVGKR